MKKQINELVGLKIKDISCGDGVGSTFILIIDENEKYKLSVYCSWRLSNKNTLITTSLESNKSQIPSGFSEIKGSEILKIKIKKFNDLIFDFERQFKLELFCDITNNIEGYFDENWYLSNSETDKVIISKGNGKLVEEIYT